MKPNIGTDSGRGVILIKYENDMIICNGQRISDEEIKTLLSKFDKYIVCEFVKQGKHGNYLYKDTVNTIRILTMIDPVNYKPFIVTAVHRIGNKKSTPVDNGSYSAKVDLETGVIGKAVVHNNINKLEWFSKHSETGTPIEGVVVPNWDKVKDSILNLASKVPYLPYVAWDVVPLDEEILIIEANNCSDVSFLQI